MLYRGWRTVLTRRSLLNECGKNWLQRLFNEREKHAALEVHLPGVSRPPERLPTSRPAHRRNLMTALIATIRTALPDGLDEIARFGRTLRCKRDEILPFFDHGRASDGPVEAISGRLERLRRTRVASL